MSRHLNFFKIRFTCSFPESTFVLTTRTKIFIIKNWIISRNRRQCHVCVLMYLKIERFNWIKWLKIIKTKYGLTVNLFHKRGNVGFVFKWKLNIRYYFLARKRELVFNIFNIILLLLIVVEPGIERSFMILSNHLFAICFVKDFGLSKLFLDCNESFTCS